MENFYLLRKWEEEELEINNILSSGETSWGSTIGKLKKINGSVNKTYFVIIYDRICDRKSSFIIFIGKYLPIKFDRKKTKGRWNYKINSI
jgi:rRNA processing protein Gar1